MSGGFTPGLRRSVTEVSGKASFLASEHYMAKRVGATFDADEVSADGDGNKIIEAGTLVTKDSSTGKYVPYVDNTATPLTSDSGYTFEAINLRDGDVIAGVIVHGSVLSARVTPTPDSTITGALAGRIVFQ